MFYKQNIKQNDKTCIRMNIEKGPNYDAMFRKILQSLYKILNNEDFIVQVSIVHKPLHNNNKFESSLKRHISGFV